MPQEDRDDWRDPEGQRVCDLVVRQESQHARLGDDRGRSLRISGRPDWASNISTASTQVRPTSFIRSTAPENRLQKGFHFLTWMSHARDRGHSGASPASVGAISSGCYFALDDTNVLAGPCSGSAVTAGNPSEGLAGQASPPRSCRSIAQIGLLYPSNLDKVGGWKLR
jgi:hypothetical protein